MPDRALTDPRTGEDFKTGLSSAANSPGLTHPSPPPGPHPPGCMTHLHQALGTRFQGQDFNNAPLGPDRTPKPGWKPGERLAGELRVSQWGWWRQGNV